MAYGTANVDVVQSSTAGVPPQFNDGNGTQTGTLCRAWVNYKGTATVGIRASFNVSSVTYNGTGDYTINFTTAMSDANYSAPATGENQLGASRNAPSIINYHTYSTTSLRILTSDSLGVALDFEIVNVAIFR